MTSVRVYLLTRTICLDINDDPDVDDGSIVGDDLNTDSSFAILS